jgi:hypothetical protein
MAQVSNLSWSLGAPDRIDVNAQGIALSEAAKFAEQRLSALEKIKQILQDGEGDFINKERNYLNDSLRFLESFWRANEDFIRTEEENVQRVKNSLFISKLILL